MKRMPLAAAAIAAAISGSAHGSGFALIEQSSSGLGNAFAGGAAGAEDAATIFYNPAGLTQLRHESFTVGANVIAPSTKFSDGGSYINPRITGGVPMAGTLRGGDGGEGGVTNVTPNLFWARKMGQTSVGLGVYTPFGMSTNYDAGWAGRYHALESELRTVNITPTVAYPVTDRLSVGAGISAQYADATLTNAVDFGTIAAALGAPGAHPATPALDGYSKVTGNSWAWGYDLGLLYTIDRDTRVGLAYRSGIDQTVKGDRTLIVPAPLAAIRPSGTVDASAALSLPDTLSASFFKQLDRWSVMGDVSWTGWSKFKDLTISSADGTVTSQPEQWRDTVRVALGANYRVTDQWLLRTGVAYDQTPIPDAQRRTPRIPDNDRTWLAVGASYQSGPELRWDFGYAHLFVPDTAINNGEVVTGNGLAGTFKSEVNLLSAQLTWSFD